MQTNTTQPKTYKTLKAEYSDAHNKVMSDHGVFWAFSDKQFDESQTPLADGDKYVSIGAGGYMPKSKFDTMLAQLKVLDKQHKKDIKAMRQDAVSIILHELNNYECLHTGDIENALPQLKSLGFTLAQVRKVYNSNRENF